MNKKILEYTEFNKPVIINEKYGILVIHNCVFNNFLRIEVMPDKLIIKNNKFLFEG